MQVTELIASSAAAAAEIVASILGTYFDDTAAESLLGAAGINDLGSGADGTEREETQAAKDLLRQLASHFYVIAAETSNIETTEYDRTPGKVTIRRGEAQLVGRYLQTVPATKATRLQLPVGFTDLYDQETEDLIEAKVSAQHSYVRQALGQLLDYAAHCTRPISCLTAPFPAEPSAADVRLLHLYGIDCLYWAGGDEFKRLKAPSTARERIRAASGHKSAGI